MTYNFLGSFEYFWSDLCIFLEKKERKISITARNALVVRAEYAIFCKKVEIETSHSSRLESTLPETTC